MIQELAEDIDPGGGSRICGLGVLAVAPLPPEITLLRVRGFGPFMGVWF